MPITKPNAIRIMDNQNLCIGNVATPIIADRIVSGLFLPTRHYKKYEKVFFDLEQAVNKLLFTHADQLERQIKDFSFYAEIPNNRKINIEDLQIMEGQIVFVITYRDDAENL